MQLLSYYGAFGLRAHETKQTPLLKMLVDGTTLVNDANLAQHDGVSHWLTRCGVDG